MKRPRKLGRVALISAGVALISATALFIFAEQILCVRSPLKTSDAVVVLGGEPVIRAEAAAHLATNGHAPLVIVSGHGDCQENRRVLEKMGVRRDRIQLECESGTTQENALYTVKLLREARCQRVIIVTSWFHSRRSLSTFRKYAPEIEFLSAPAPRRQPWRYERHYIAAEYLKIVGYCVRFGILPLA